VTFGRSERQLNRKGRKERKGKKEKGRKEI